MVLIKLIPLASDPRKIAASGVCRAKAALSTDERDVETEPWWNH